MREIQTRMPTILTRCGALLEMFRELRWEHMLGERIQAQEPDKPCKKNDIYLNPEASSWS